jgi:hypothetical protein
MYYIKILKEQIKLSFMSIAIFRANFMLMLLQSIINSVLVSYKLYSFKNGKKNYASTAEKLENSEVRSIFFTFKPATIAAFPRAVK